MTRGYIRNPPLRYPCVQPLFHETYLQAKFREKNLTDLWRRCDYVKSAVDDGPPKCVINVRLKLKKLLAEGERLAFIERDNRFLLKNILRVMKGPGTVDHFHKFDLSRHTTTLNYTRRKQEINRINIENKAMLKRILSTRTCYNRIKMEMEYQYRIRSIRGRSYIYQLWRQFAEERREQIMTGRYLPEGYGEVDMDELRRLMAEKHRYCFPVMPDPLVHPRPLPRSSCSPPRAAPVDHDRCFTPQPILPPIHHPRPPKMPEGEVVVHETKTQKLRRELLQQKKTESLKPQRFERRTRSPSPPRPKPEDKGGNANVNQSAQEKFPCFPSYRRGDKASPYASPMVMQDKFLPACSDHTHVPRRPADAEEEEKEEGEEGCRAREGVWTKTDAPGTGTRLRVRLRPLSSWRKAESCVDGESSRLFSWEKQETIDEEPGRLPPTCRNTNACSAGEKVSSWRRGKDCEGGSKESPYVSSWLEGSSGEDRKKGKGALPAARIEKERKKERLLLPSLGGSKGGDDKETNKAPFTYLREKRNEGGKKKKAALEDSESDVKPTARAKTSIADQKTTTEQDKASADRKPRAADRYQPSNRVSKRLIMPPIHATPWRQGSDDRPSDVSSLSPSQSLNDSTSLSDLISLEGTPRSDRPGSEKKPKKRSEPRRSRADYDRSDDDTRPSRSSAKQAWSPASARSLDRLSRSMTSRDDHDGNTTDDAEDLPESSVEESASCHSRASSRRARSSSGCDNRRN